jgi:hypothetical protein
MFVPATSFYDFEQILAPSYVELGASKDEEYRRMLNGVPYLDTKHLRGGVGVSDLDAMQARFYKSLACMTVAQMFEGRKTKLRYGQWIACMKWWCRDCGKIGGRINKRRIRKLREVVNEPESGIVIRQVVFTVPGDIAPEFMSRPAMNSLARNAQNVIKKYFPGRKCASAVQLFGDRGEFRFHPHVHVLIWEKRGCTLMLPQELLDDIREMWRRSLQGFLTRPVRVVDIHCSFANTPQKISHLLRYFTRPVPGPTHFKKMLGNIPLMHFCMNIMKGFVVIRYFNGIHRNAVRDESVIDDRQNAVGLAGEPLRLLRGETITRTVFNMLYLPHEYTILSDRLWRIDRGG